MSGSQPTALRVTIEADTGAAVDAFKQLTATADKTAKDLARAPGKGELGLAKPVAAEVEAVKDKLRELPAAARAEVGKVARAASEVRLLDAPALAQAGAEISGSVDRVQAAFTRLRDHGVRSQGALAQAVERTRDAVGRLREQAASAGGVSSQPMDGLAAKAQALVASIAALATGNVLVRTVDNMRLLQGRLELVEGSAQAAAQRLEVLRGVADRAGADVGATGDAYARMAGAIRRAGGDSQKATDFTEVLALALRASGASAQETSSVLLQVGQSLQKGKLQGDEFVSVAENGGRVLDYLADVLGVTRGELAQMATEGRLTTAELLRLTEALGRAREEAGLMPRTVEQSFTRLVNAVKLWVTQSATAQAVADGLAGGMDVLAEHLDAALQVVLALAAGAVILGIVKLAAALKAAALAGAAFALANPAVLAASAAVAGLVLLAEPIDSLWQRLSRADGAQAPLQRLSTSAQDLRRVLGEMRKELEALSGQLGERMQQAKARAGEAAQEIPKAYEGAARRVGDALGARQAGIDRALTEQLAAVREGVAAQTALVVAAENQKLDAADSAALRLQALWDVAYGRLGEAARGLGLDVAAIEREALGAREAALRQWEQAYRATVDRLLDEERRHLDEVRRIEQSRADFRLSLEDRVRELTRRGMDAAAAFSDRQRQVDEKQAAARAALAAGNFAQARQLAEASIALAERNAAAVRSGGQEVVSEAQASAAAVAQVRRAAELVEAAMDGMAASHRTAAQVARAGADEATAQLARIEEAAEAVQARLAQAAQVQVSVSVSTFDAALAEVERLLAARTLVAKVLADTRALDEAIKGVQERGAEGLFFSLRPQVMDLDARLAELRTSLAQADVQVPAGFDQARQGLAAFERDLRASLGAVQTVSAHVVESNAEDVQRALDALQGRDTTSEHTVFVRQVQQRALGGLVTPVARLAEGGRVMRQAWRRVSGRVFGPGTETSDSVPTMLSAGEFVVRAAAVRRFGAGLFEALNAGRMPAALSVGAAMGPAARRLAGAAARAVGGADGGGEQVLRLLSPDGRQSVRLRSDRDEAMRMVELLRGVGVRLEVAR